MNRNMIATCVAASLLTCCAGPSRTLPPASSPVSLAQQRSTELLGRARQARGAGQITASLEFYERAVTLGGPERVLAAREALQILDGLKLEVVSGSRQAATARLPPRLPLMARATFDNVQASGGASNSIPAAGVPVIWKWSTGGEDNVLGERSSDENGMVALRVTQMPESAEAKLDLFFDTDEMPLPRGASDAELTAAFGDAVDALKSRKVRFEFVPITAATKSRVLVVIDEQVFGEQVDQSLVSDRLTTTLVDRGVKVVGSTELGKSDYIKLQQTFDTDQWVALAPALAKLCDYVVYGHVQVRRDYENAGGGLWAVARGRVSLYGTYHPEIMASVDYSNVAGFAGDTWQNAAEECLRKCSDMTTKKLVPLVVQTSGQ